METFPALLNFCAGNSPVTGEFPSQRPVTPSFDIFFDLRLNKQLSKQWMRRWLGTLSRSFWRHCNVYAAGIHYAPISNYISFNPLYILWDILELCSVKTWFQTYSIIFERHVIQNRCKELSLLTDP